MALPLLSTRTIATFLITQPTAIPSDLIGDTENQPTASWTSLPYRMAITDPAASGNPAMVIILLNGL